MAFTPDDKINLHWPHGIPVCLITLALALAIPAAADSGTWSGEVTLTGPNVYVEEGAYIVPADTGFEVEFDGKYEPSDPDLKDELEDEDDPRASYRYQWTFAPDGQAVGPDDKRQVTGKFTQASSAEDDKTVSVEVEVVGEGVTGEIKETFQKSLTAIGLASLTAAEDGSDPENSAVTTDPGDTQTLYVVYTEDAEENSTTVINLAAVRTPSGDFPDTLPTWTLTAPDGADELEYEPGAAFDYTAQVPGVYLFTAECGNELTVTVAVTSSDALIAEDKANAENTAVTTEPSAPKRIYIPAEIKLTAVPAPGTAFASGEPEWTVTAVPDGVDAESIDLPEDGEETGDVLLPAVGEYAFTAEWGEIELTVEVVTLEVDILADTNRARRVSPPICFYETFFYIAFYSRQSDAIHPL